MSVTSPRVQTGRMMRRVVPVVALTILMGGLTACGPSQDEAGAPTKVDEAAVATSEPVAAPTTVTAAPSSAGPSTPVVEKRTVRVTKAIPYPTRTVKDSSRPEGTKSVRVKGAAGVRTLTYEVTLTDGTETGRKLVTSVVTKRPVTRVVAVGTKSASHCDPNYSGQCVPIASDVDCGGGSGNGPAYVYGMVKVIGEDIYGLDRDGDGYGCE